MNFFCSSSGPPFSQIASRLEQIYDPRVSEVQGLDEEEVPSSLDLAMRRIWQVLDHLMPESSEVQELAQDIQAIKLSSFTQKMQHLTKLLDLLTIKVKNKLLHNIEAELNEVLQLMQTILKEKQVSNDLSLGEMFAVQVAMKKIEELSTMASSADKPLNSFDFHAHIG